MKKYIICLNGDYQGTIVARDEKDAQKRAMSIFPKVNKDDLLIVEDK
jgi:hypothetical protein